MFRLWFQRMKNSISSYSLPLCLSHGTRRTNLSPQDQAKYKLSSDQAQVHVSSPSLCVLESPFTGFSSSTAPTSSEKTKSHSHQHDKKKLLGLTCIIKKSIQNQTPIYSKIYCCWQLVPHVLSVQNSHSWHLITRDHSLWYYLSFHTYASYSDCLSIWWLLLT